MKNAFLSGRKVHLRPIEREDAALVCPWLNDPDVRRTLLLHRPISRHFEEDWIVNDAKDQSTIHFVICTREGRPVGVCGLMAIDARNAQAGFGISIGEKSMWGKGLGTEATGLLVAYAFETLNLHRVWLHVLEHNEAGIRAYEKVGFRREGLLRQNHFVDGEYCNTLVMAVLRPEWKAARRARTR